MKILMQLRAQAKNSDTFAKLRTYLGKWSKWLKQGLKDIPQLETYVTTLLPSVALLWLSDGTVGAAAL
jgi:hypothetical protein